MKIPSGESRIFSTDVTLTDVLEVEGTLTLDPTKNITLSTNKNILVTGKLISNPNPDVIHTIRFTGVDENKFVGSGMDVLDSDIGLWVMGAGQLDLQGAEKTGWTNQRVPILSGDTRLDCNLVKGWQPGDELMVTPTAKGASNYDVVAIKSIGINLVDVNKPLTAHPIIASKFTPEVANLTRNMRIEGTPTGQSHIFIHSTAVQTIRYVCIRYMGPRKDQGSDSAKEFVIGRYGLHFHHCGFIPGTLIEGCVVRDTGSHAYVPHGSHNITFRGNVAYNVTETAFWYDLGHKTHNTLYEGNLVAFVKYVPQSLAMDLKETDPDMGPTFASSGFLLGMGDGNICRGNVVVGTQGDYRTGGGYMWEANDEGIWDFNNNLAHNCNGGIRVWQNTENNHVINRFAAYNCEAGVFHGAYANSYTYDECEVINCPFIFHSASVNTSRLRLLRSKLDTIVIEGSPLPGMLPILVRDCTYKSLIDQAGKPDEPGSHSVDIVNCTGTNSVSSAAQSAEVLRVQPKTGQPTKITKAGTTNIQPFAPTLWGSGTGLKGEYYNDATFTNKVFERVDSYIGFGEWGNGIHYLITSPAVSVRWTGFIEPQFSETFTFAASGKLMIDGKIITGPVALSAGKRYPIKLEYSNTSDKPGASLAWSSAGIQKFSPGGELVPQSQLYPGDVATPPPPGNKPPVANAGADQTIITQALLTGTGADPEGGTLTYKWEQIGGIPATILNTDMAITRVQGLQPGENVFRLTVTDDKGATGSDEVKVIVK